jgi:hypothetical protein
MLATAFLKNRMRWTGIKWRNIIRPGSTLQRPAWDICSFRLLQKTLFLMGSCHETTGFSIGPLDVCSMVAWQCRPVCSPHPQPPQGHQEGVIRAKGKKCGVYQCRHVLAVVSGLSATRKLVRNGFWGVHQIGNDARKSWSTASLES